MRTTVFSQLSPIKRAVVSHEALSFCSPFFIIKYGEEKKCTMLHKIRIQYVF